MRAEDLRCAFECVCDLRAANCRSASARTIINNSGLIQLLPCSYDHSPISQGVMNPAVKLMFRLLDLAYLY
jgi:hypothetical protein